MAYINGHQYVDLGLPSGLKWATYNLGANSTEEFGDYFAWGETETKDKYKQDNSETYEVYQQWLLDNGFIDNDGNLTKKYDAVCMHWGTSWRMPTLQEITELLDNTDCYWGTLNGVNGCTLISTINGNSLFLPASGWKNGSKVECSGERGYYWSSSIHNHNVEGALDLLFSTQFVREDWGMRSAGFNIRAVSE